MFTRGGGTVTTGQSTPGAFLAALDEAGIKAVKSRDDYEAMNPYAKQRFVLGGGRVSMGEVPPPYGATRTVSREEFVAMTPAERREFQISGGRALI